MKVERSDALSNDAAAYLAGRIRSGAANGRPFHVALSGGRAPWTVFARLAQEHDLDWPLVHIHQVDERAAPAGSDDRNLTHLERALTSKVPAVVHAMPVEEVDLDVAAAEYAAALPAQLDLVHLGLGPDGHTASLVPGDPVLAVTDRDVAVTDAYMGHRRMTLTYPAINRAAEIVWIVSGDDKADALGRLLAGDPTIPASGIRSAGAVLLTDQSESHHGSDGRSSTR